MAGTYLTRQISNAGTNRTKATISLWAKIGNSIGNDQRFFSYENTSVSNNVTVFKFVGLAGGNMGIQFADQTGGSNNAKFDGTRALRDPSAWYHFVLKVDTTQVTNTDRLKIYINGELQTSTHGSYTYPSQDSTLNFGHNSNAYIDIGRWRGSNNQYFDGSISHFHYTDGYAYDASEFGETDATTGQWKIKTGPSVTYGTNGFFILKNGNIITDSSSNSNNFTLGGGTLTNTEDCPDNVFCTLNPIGHAAPNFTLIEGNLYSGGADNVWRSIFGTLGAQSGKYYYEMKVIGHNNEHVGIASADQIAHCSDSSGKFTDNSYGAEGYSYTSGGQKANNGSEVSWGNSYTTNDIIGVAFDLDNSKLYFSKNGTWQESGDPTSGATGTGAAYTLVANKIYLPAMASYNAASNMAFNFGNGFFRTTAVASAGTNASGNGIFEYDVPTGYTALTTKGLNL